jgi:hypothetical protein
LWRPDGLEKGRLRAHILDMRSADIDRYRKMADECREQAERAHSPIDQERWLRLAGNWTLMAQEAEARHGK